MIILIILALFIFFICIEGWQMVENMFVVWKILNSPFWILGGGRQTLQTQVPSLFMYCIIFILWVEGINRNHNNPVFILIDFEVLSSHLSVL